MERSCQPALGSNGGMREMAFSSSTCLCTVVMMILVKPVSADDWKEETLGIVKIVPDIDIAFGRRKMVEPEFSITGNAAARGMIKPSQSDIL
jgi:hypothetical protein